MKPPRREIFADINITPLTDIFLVLLIIMMVVAPMLDYRGLDMKVATDAPSDAKTDENTWLRLGVAADGQYKVNEAPVDIADLAAELRRGIEGKEALVIEVDPESNHAALAHAIDAARVAGIEQVSVIKSTPPSEEPQESPPKKSKKK